MRYPPPSDRCYLRGKRSVVGWASLYCAPWNSILAEASGTKNGALSRIGGRRGLARTVVQQKVATTMALSSLQALGFGICAPVSPSSYMSPWQERPDKAKGPFT